MPCRHLERGQHGPDDGLEASSQRTKPNRFGSTAHPLGGFRLAQLCTAIFLLIPLLGNHLIDGWNWPPCAFVSFGAFLFGIGFTCELVTRNRDAVAYRAAVGIAFAAAFLLAWGDFVQMADVTPAAAMYFLVPVVEIIGVIAARFRLAGMARALFATALAQALVLNVVLILLRIRNPHVTSWTPPEWRGFVGNAFNVLLFAASAWLFRQAERQKPEPGAV